MFHKITLRYGCQRTHTQQRDVSKRSPDSRANSTSCLEKPSLRPRRNSTLRRRQRRNCLIYIVMFESIARSRGSSAKLGRTLLIVPDPPRLSFSFSLSLSHIHARTHICIFRAWIIRTWSFIKITSDACQPRFLEDPTMITRPAHSGTKLYHISNYW